jgi:hypothetical protein
MNKRRKQGLVFLALSVPMMWFGFTNFMSGTTSNTALAVGTAIGCVFGAFFALSGLTMLITKNSLGIWNPDDKGKKGRGEEILASQTKVGDSPILEKENNKKQKVNEMAESKENTSVDLMKREKELETRRKEVVAMLKEITKEETAVVEEIKSKGWVQKENGEWSIG